MEESKELQTCHQFDQKISLRCENAEVVQDPVSLGALAVRKRRVDDVVDLGSAAGRAGTHGRTHRFVEYWAARKRLLLLGQIT